MNDDDPTVDEVAHRRTLLTERLAALGTAADGLTHEVYNPLNCALLQLAVLRRRLELPDCEPASLQPVAELVEQALRRLEVLFNDLVSVLQPPWPAGAVLVAARVPVVVTVVRADVDAGGTRVALDLVVELPPIDAGEPMTRV